MQLATAALWKHLILPSLVYAEASKVADVLASSCAARNSPSPGLGVYLISWSTQRGSIIRLLHPHISVAIDDQKFLALFHRFPIQDSERMQLGILESRTAESKPDVRADLDCCQGV